MRRSGFALAGFFFALVSGPSFAETVEESVDRLLEVTGIAEQAAMLSDTLVTLMDQQKAVFDQASYDVILAILNEEFGSTVFEDYIKASLVESYNRSFSDAVMKAYDSELFKNLTKAETELFSSSYADRLEAFDYAGISPARNALFEEFLAAAKILEFQDLSIKGALAAYIGTFNLFLPKEKRIDAEVEKMIVDATLAEVNGEESLLVMKKSLALSYEDFSDREVAEYLGFYKSAEGTWLNSCYYEGFQEGFVQAMKRSASRIIDAFGLVEEKT